MHRRFALSALVLTFCLSLTALAEPPQEQKGLEEWKPTGFLSTSFYDKYIAARINRELTSTPVIWSEAYVNLPKGFFTDFWMSNGLDDSKFSSNFGDEIDMTLGWKGKFEGWDVKFAVLYMDIVPLGTIGSGKDVIDYAAFLSPGEYTFGKHTFRPEWRMEWMSDADDIEAGAAILMPNITHTWKEPLDIKSLCWINQYRVAWDSGFRGNDSSGVFFQVDGGLQWRITKDITWMMPGYRIIMPLDDPTDGREFKVAIMTGIQWNF